MTQYLASGIALGAVYALIALGFVIIYRASQVFNFAQGELVMVGAYLMWTLLEVGVPWIVAMPLAMALTGGLAALIERAVLRPFVGRPVFVPIIITIIVGILLRTLVLLVWGTLTRGMSTPWERTSTWSFAGATILVNEGAAILAGTLALAACFALIRYTRLGLAMRAASSDQETAMALGVPVGRVLGSTWFIAGALAALAGTFLSMYPNSVEPNLGFVALVAFPAVIVGGLDSALGAVIAAFALGVLEILTQAYVSPALGSFGHNFHTVFPYLVMILFLMVRPYGLLGTHEVQRV